MLLLLHSQILSADPKTKLAKAATAATAKEGMAMVAGESGAGAGAST